MKTVNTVRQVKQNNLSLIRAVIRSSGSVTKHSVSQKTGLSIATANNLLNALVESGEVIEAENENNLIGRPAKSYRYNENFAHICCLFPSSVGNTLHMYYSILDLMGKTLEEKQLPMDRIGYDSFELLVRTLLTQDPKITIFCIGIPAYVDEDFIHTCTIKELNGVDLLGRLRETFPCRFYLQNNMNAIAYGIYEAEKKKNEQTGNHSFSSLAVIGFFTEGGTGSGIILDGRIHAGETGFAGELGILPAGDGTISDLANGTRDDIIRSSVISVTSLAAILNPAMCVFTGENVSPDICDEIRRQCAAYIPERHMPSLRYISDYNRFYTQGLFDLALQEELY